MSRPESPTANTPTNEGQGQDSPAAQATTELEETGQASPAAQATAENEEQRQASPAPNENE